MVESRFGELKLENEKTLQGTLARLWRVAKRVATIAAAGGLTFRELEALASTSLTWLLTLTRARVTLHVAFLLKWHT